MASSVDESGLSWLIDTAVLLNGSTFNDRGKPATPLSLLPEMMTAAEPYVSVYDKNGVMMQKYDVQNTLYIRGCWATFFLTELKA